MIQGKCYRCSTSGEVTVCEECGQVFCSRCYPMHTPCAMQLQTAEVDALGDKGQRYVIRCLGPEGKVRTVGYVTNSNLVTTMVLAVMLHPSFHSPSVIDREAPVVPKPPLHTSDLWCAGYELALRSYAYWKDGIQYVGSTGKTLKEALIDMRKE